MDSSLLINTTIKAIHLFAFETVHAAWIDELTTPIATSMAILELSDGRFVKLSTCEIEVDPGKYPSLGLALELCNRESLHWKTTTGERLAAKTLEAASTILPLTVSQIVESDPLMEGAISEINMIGPQNSHLLFRHIMPPMTLGIDWTASGASSSAAPAHPPR